MTRSFTKKVVFISIYILVNIIIVFAALEIFARYYFPNRLLSPFATFENRPNLPYLLFGDSGQYVDFTGRAKFINELGFHAAHTYTIEKPGNTYRIFFFGGSVAAYGGDGFPKDKIYYELLSKKLKQRFPQINFECISGGTASYIANQEMVWFAFSRVFEMEPDMIVMFDGYNDIDQPLNMWSEIGYPFIYKHRNMMFSSPVYYFIGKLSNRSLLIKYFFNYYIGKKIELSKRAFIEDPNSQNHLASNYVANIEKIAILLKAYHPQTQMMVALQPILAHKNNLTDDEKLILSKGRATGDYVKKTYPLFMDRLRESNILRERDVFVADIINSFENAKGLVFADMCHFSKYGGGQEIIADKFFDLIEPVIQNKLDTNKG